MVSKCNRMVNKVFRTMYRMVVPRTTSIFLLTFFLVVIVKHAERRVLIRGGKTAGNVAGSYIKRKILSGDSGHRTKHEQITTVTADASTSSNKSSFYSLIPSQNLLTAGHQQAWIEIKNPSHYERSKQSKIVALIHNRRRSQLRSACRPVGKISHEWLENIQLIAAPKRRLVVCHVQKAGSTSWHKLIYNLRHNYDDARPWTNEGHIENRNFTRDLPGVTKRALTKSRDATRVLCIRHPFARLISGWNNKFHKNFVASVGNVMFKSMPGLADYVNEKSPPDKDHVISFEDFVRYVADHGLDKVDAHFKTVEQLCKPCSFPYDFIVKAETAPNDLWWLLNRVNATMERFLVHDAVAMAGDSIEVDSHGLTSSERIFSAIVRHFFSRVPRDTIRGLMALYYDDFARFGYTFDIDTLSAGGFR